MLKIKQDLLFQSFRNRKLWQLQDPDDLIRLRLSKATVMMKSSGASIGGIAAMCGYPNQLHFSRAFKKHYGVSPREWRDKNRG